MTSAGSSGAAPVFTLALLTEHDADDVLDFERRNRGFFAGWVGDRGDEWFATFAERHNALVAENRDGMSMLYLVRDADGAVIGRVNLSDVDGEVAELGYRMAESAQGRGIASAAVQEALAAAFAAGVTCVEARVFADNVGSQRVLERAGFVLTDESREIRGQPVGLYRLRRA